MMDVLKRLGFGLLVLVAFICLLGMIMFLFVPSVMM